MSRASYRSRCGHAPIVVAAEPLSCARTTLTERVVPLARGGGDGGSIGVGLLLASGGLAVLLVGTSLPVTLLGLLALAWYLSIKKTGVLAAAR